MAVLPREGVLGRLVKPGGGGWLMDLLPVEDNDTRNSVALTGFSKAVPLAILSFW